MVLVKEWIYIHSNLIICCDSFFLSFLLLNVFFIHNNDHKHNNESSHWLFNDYVFSIDIFSSDFSELNLTVQRNVVTIWITLNNRLESFSHLKPNTFFAIEITTIHSYCLVLSDFIEFSVNSIVLIYIWYLFVCFIHVSIQRRVALAKCDKYSRTIRLDQLKCVNLTGNNNRLAPKEWRFISMGFFVVVDLF